MKNKTKLFGIIAVIAVIGASIAACDNGNRGPEIPGNVVTNARIAVTGIPADHYDADDENEYLRGGMMTIRDGDGEPVATGIADVIDGSMTVELMDGDDPWDGSGGHFIELVFSYYGGSYYYTGGLDFSAILPPTFDRHNDDLFEHLPTFNIAGTHAIALSQFRHSGTIPEPAPPEEGVKIAVTGIPADHYDAEDENEYLRGGMMTIRDGDGEPVATGIADVIDGSMAVELMDGDDPWNGSGGHFIELTFSYYGGSYYFTGGQDFGDILPPTFDRHNDDLFEHLPTFNIAGTHVIALTQFRHSGAIPEPAFTVTFETGGGLPEPESQQVPAGEFASAPATPPTKTGYRFDWWSAPGQTTAFAFTTTAITADITLTAQWTQTYTVTFNSDGGTAVAPQEVASGDFAALPTPPTKADHRFDWWYHTDEATEFAFTTTAIAEPITLTAKWTGEKTFEITFDADGGLPEPDPQHVPAGEFASAPATPPAKAGYRFDWWSAPGETTAFAFATTAITADITLTAQWTQTYAVTFNTHNGTPVPPVQNVAQGGFATRPATNPTRTGFTFVDWFTAETDGGVFNFAATPINAATVVHARWQADSGGGYTPTAGLYRGALPNLVAADRVATVPANSVVAAVTYVNANPGHFTLLVDAPVTVTDTLTIQAGVHLTVAGTGGRQTITRTGNGNLFNVNGASLTLGDNITLAGHGGNNAPLVLVQGSASLTMNNGAQITGNTASGNNQAAGVHVTGAGSIFTMNSGVIYGNTATGTLSGGGVRVTGGASFYMSGDAVIQTNTATGAGSAGGVYVAGINSTFTMLGGEIRGNGANGLNTVGGVGADGGGALRMVTGVIHGAGSANPNTSAPGPASSFAVLRLGGGTTPGIAERGTLDGNWDPASAVSLLPGTGVRGTGETIRVVDGVRDGAFTVTFNTHGGAPVPTAQDVTQGGFAARPATNPSRDGLTFVDWFTTAETGGDVFAFATTPINADTVVHARWGFTLTFDSAGGSAVASQTVIASGGLATEPTPPTRAFTPGAPLPLPTGAGLWATQYTFGGWHLNGAPFAFTTPITGNITLTAQWTAPTAMTLVAGVAPNDVAAAVTHVNANPANGPFALLVDGAVTVTDTLTIQAGVHLTVAGTGGRQTITRTGNGNIFTLNGADRSLTLGDNITLAGYSANIVPLVLVQGGASLTMNAGAQITGNTATGNNQAGGVHVTGANSIFTMNGGVIHGNTATGTLSGGGVRVTGGASFYMSGDAVIQTNTVTGAGSAGGVYVAGINSTFTMLGGEIRGNGANGFNTVGGVGADGGALRMVTGVIYGAGSANPNTSVPGPASSFAVLRLGGGTTPGIAERGTLDGSGNWDPASAVSLLPGAGVRGTGETIRVANGVLQ